MCADDKKQLICICCPTGCKMTAFFLPERKVVVRGNRCKRGEKYAAAELLHPMRSLTTTARVAGGEQPLVPVRTKQEIPKEALTRCMAVLKTVTVTAPVKPGDVVVRNIAGTGADIIATKAVSARKEYPLL